MSILAVATAAVLGATDGVAASGDTIAGRHWDSPGMSYTGVPVVEWGWAPAVQAVGIVGGVAGVATARSRPAQEVSRGMTIGAMACFARAVGFKLGQRGQATPVLTEGYRG